MGALRWCPAGPDSAGLLLSGTRPGELSKIPLRRMRPGFPFAAWRSARHCAILEIARTCRDPTSFSRIFVTRAANSGCQVGVSCTSSRTRSLHGFVMTLTQLTSYLQPSFSILASSQPPCYGASTTHAEVRIFHVKLYGMFHFGPIFGPFLASFCDFQT